MKIMADTPDLSADTDIKAKSNSVSGSLLRGLSLIETLAASPTPQLLIELAERVRLDSATVYRLLQTLCQQGYATRLNSKRYCAGPRTIRLLGTYHPVNNLCRECEPVLQELRTRLDETITLIIFLGTERVIVKVEQGREILSSSSYDTWLRTPLHGSASGKLLLMQMSAEQRRDALGPPPYKAATEFTEVDEAALSLQIDRARERGFAVARDDAFVGLTALAAPIIWDGHTLGCLAIVGSSWRLRCEMEESLGTVLCDTATLIANAVPSIRQLAHFVEVWT